MISEQYNKIEFIAKCYKMYQLKWIMDHGYSLQDIFNVLEEGYIEYWEPFPMSKMANTSLEDDFKEIVSYFEEHGFNGSIFSSEGEFYDNEYHNEEYMKTMLPEDMFKTYLNYKEV